MRWRSCGSLILSLAIAAPAAAQAYKPPRVGDDRARSGNDRDRSGGVGAPRGPGGPMRLGDDSRRGPGRRGFGQGRGQQIDASVLDPKRLTEELKLEWRQREEVEQIFREYKAALAELRQQFRGANTERDKERLEQELKSARQARDFQRAGQIMNKLRQLRTTASDEEKELQELLIEEIEKVLDEGQKVQFRRMLRPGSDRGRGVGPLDDPEVLARCLQQIELQDYQKTRLEQIKRSYEDEVKRRGEYLRPEDKKMMRKRLLDDVMMVLNEEQKDQLKRVHAKMGGPGTVGAPIDLNDPRQLQFAVMRLNTTKHRLSREQHVDIRRIQKQYMLESRRLPRDDDEGRRRLAEQTAQQVMLVLTPEQQEEIKNMQMPAGRYPRGRRGRFSRGAAGGYDDDQGGRGRRSRSERSSYR